MRQTLDSHQVDRQKLRERVEQADVFFQQPPLLGDVVTDNPQASLEALDIGDLQPEDGDLLANSVNSPAQRVGPFGVKVSALRPLGIRWTLFSLPAPMKRAKSDPKLAIESLSAHSRARSISREVQNSSTVSSRLRIPDHRIV